MSKPNRDLAYVGGFMRDRISLHCITTGNRLGKEYKPKDCVFFAYNSWRMYAA